MSQSTEPSSIEAGEMTLDELLKRVREQGRPLRITEQGIPIAELSPLPARRQLEPVNPRLKATFLSNQISSEEDWPEHLRIDITGQTGDAP